ncbi:MAG: selenocysteine-specific translation elongation factor [Chitinivibrionales bacterium]|nr:selenocysteine-specific translation elongation factor [Chitinivibrionales bacterium]
MARHLIMGTAGHIDHGKTALVHKLTGIECDTHKEEKRRGITINLGFAHATLANGDSIGIVDVPGHKNFVHTMVSGACGIDFVLMVIAADSGIMPQTREHLHIMHILGIRHGLTALNKIDLVDKEVCELAQEEIAEFTEGTFLEGAPVVPVSSRTGEGFDELNAQLNAIAAKVKERPSGEVFRLYIDRIFSVSGFGTVVTGSVLSGRLSLDSKAYLLPGEDELRVRRIERHGAAVQEVIAGDRASLNLTGMNRDSFRRGMLVSDRPLRSTQMIDARLTLFNHSRRFGIWTQVIFLFGTFEAQARVHLIDKNSLHGGEEAIVQIHLPAPCVVQAGDKYVIRSSSSDVTLGGGELLDALPLHHRRRPQELIEGLSKIAAGKLPELVAVEVRKQRNGTSAASLSSLLNKSEREICSILIQNMPHDICVFTHETDVLAAPRPTVSAFEEKITRKLATYHKYHPLEKGGLSANELYGILGVDKNSDGARLIQLVLDDMQRKSLLKKVRHSWALPSHQVTLSEHQRREIDFVKNFLDACGMKMPTMSVLHEQAASRGMDAKKVRSILHYLAARGDAYYIEPEFVSAKAVDPSREKLINALKQKPAGLTVAEFRNLTDGNRRICLFMYALFDNEGLTVRQGDVRVLRGP